jgi:hypothetical protein
VSGTGGCCARRTGGARPTAAKRVDGRSPEVVLPTLGAVNSPQRGDLSVGGDQRAYFAKLDRDITRGMDSSLPGMVDRERRAEAMSLLRQWSPAPAG